MASAMELTLGAAFDARSRKNLRVSQMAAIFCIWATVLTTWAPSMAATPRLELTLSSEKLTYAANEPIRLTLRLKNVSSSSVTVAGTTVDTTSVKVALVGGRIKQVKRYISPPVGLSSQVYSSLKTLAPGESVSFPLNIIGVTGAQSLSILSKVKASSTSQQMLLYGLGRPGVYSGRATYKFRTKEYDSSFPNVTHSNVKSNIIQFSVSP